MDCSATWHHQQVRFNSNTHKKLGAPKIPGGKAKGRDHTGFQLRYPDLHSHSAPLQYLELGKVIPSPDLYFLICKSEEVEMAHHFCHSIIQVSSVITNLCAVEANYHCFYIQRRFFS
jgi:hypothetical protein